MWGFDVMYSYSSKQADMKLLKHQKWLQSNNIKTLQEANCDRHIYCPQSSTQNKII